MTSDPAPRTVRVRCKTCCGEGQIKYLYIGREPELRVCWTCRGEKSVPAILADPEAEALMADGERYRAGNVRQRGPDHEGGPTA